MTDKKSDDEERPVKELSVFPSITALLKPTADYVGIELRNYVRSQVEELKAKRCERNIVAHLKGVREKIASDHQVTPKDGPTFAQLNIFDQWMEHAQDVDPEDVELSEIWRNLLARAARGSNTPSEIIDAIKVISPREAKFLTKLSGMSGWLRIISTAAASGENRYLAKTLESKGLLEKNYTFGVLILILLTIIGILLYYFFTPHFMWFIMLAGVLGTILYTQMDLFRWRFSWLGGELIQLVREKSSKAEKCPTTSFKGSLRGASNRERRQSA